MHQGNVAASPILPKDMNNEIKEILTDAIRYWEPRRLIYNGFLAIVSIVAHFSTQEAYRQKASLGTLVGLIVLAVVANLLYCAAYLPDIAVQFTEYRATWRKARIVLFVFGTLFAGLLALLCMAPRLFD
jgi:hypothetical protein